MNRRKGAPYFLGIDVGSVSVNTVILTEQKLIAEEYYHRHHGQPLATVRSVLKDIFSRIPPVDFVDISFVGTGGKLPAELLSVRFANEIVAQCKATEFFHPNIKTVIEMGGEDSKLIILDHDKDLTTSKLVNFSMNTMCAAGTGSFLDQQAHRLNVTIEEFGQLALKSKNPSSIAGRCSVFAKSDMIHLQQIATPDHDIIAGLCFALARNFKSTIGKGYTFHPPLAFQGGVAANVGMRRAFAGILALAPHEIIIPRHFASMGAIGACLMAIGSPSLCTPWTGWRRFDESGASAPRETATEAPLSFLCRNPVLSKAPCFPVQRGGKIRGYLGLDVGSISTNLVVINENRRVLAKRYLMTTGRPIEAIKRGLREIGEELNGSIEIAGAGATGSGRYLTGDFVGADVIRNEITAQATASANIDCEVDTIFEIGGQDSKYISLKNGAVVDFEMNKVCAAGTGSFLEEQAEKLGISIEKEFGTMALAAPAPVALGDRCTVFIESDLVHHQQRGAEKENLVAGLCYSIVRNYLNKVVSTKKIGDRIFFQGGTAFNEGVVAAFEKVLGKRITVPPDNEVTGAIGAAILAMKEKDDEPSRFKGFDLSRREYLLSSFPCNGCANMCEIHKLEVKDEKPLFYGGRCEKWEIKRSKKNISDIPDLFSERDELLHRFQEQNNRMPVSAPSVGIPRVLFFHDLLPFWGTYFNGLGFRVVLSEQTNRTIIRKGLETVVTETCFPIKVTHGHILDLIEKGVSAIFLPSLITLKRLQRHIKHSYSCPYVQSVPYTIQSTIDFKESGVVLLHPPVFMGRELHMLGKDLQKTIARKLDRSKEHHKAFIAAWDAQQDFESTLRKRGEEVLSKLDAKAQALVIVSRSYNGCDPGINLRIPRILRDMGVIAIPIDMLPLDAVDTVAKWRGMYWGYGQKILAAAQIIKNDPRLFAVYITNFSCGPDSFISHFFRKELAEKPYLQIEIDEHSADAGVVTRLEAFLDSLKNIRLSEALKVSPPQLTILRSTNGKKKTVYIPYMTDHVYALAAAFHACGTPAEVMPESDSETVTVGRKYTSGRECYPCILTIGNMVKMVNRPDIDPERTAFFMPNTNGPCRFGQYYHFQRLVLDDLGYPDISFHSFNQDDGIYGDCEIVGNDFARLAWQGIVAIDLLEKKLREVRPYEINNGEADQIYRHYLKEITECIKGKANLTKVLQEARDEFDHLSIDGELMKPVIGLVGEIYIRTNRFGNENIVRELEALGSEVWLPSVGEWILYTNFTAMRNSITNRRWKNFLKILINNRYQRYYEHHLSKVLAPSLKNCSEPSTKEVLQYAEPYLDPTFEGEAILSVGKAVDFAKKGVDGIINVMPFTCMPGTIVNTLLKKFREMEGNIPVLNISYDGQKQTNTRTRLEAFVYQVCQFQKSGARRSPNVARDQKPEKHQSFHL